MNKIKIFASNFGTWGWMETTEDGFPVAGSISFLTRAEAVEAAKRDSLVPESEFEQETSN